MGHFVCIQRYDIYNTHILEDKLAVVRCLKADDLAWASLLDVHRHQSLEEVLLVAVLVVEDILRFLHPGLRRKSRVQSPRLVKLETNWDGEAREAELAIGVSNLPAEAVMVCMQRCWDKFHSWNH